MDVRVRNDERPCRFCVAYHGEYADAEMCEMAHRLDQGVYALAAEMARRFQPPPVTDERIGWFLEDADAVIDDFDPRPERWRIRVLPDNGRRPVVAKTRTLNGDKPLGSNDRTINPNAGGLRVGAHMVESTATITGYACRCGNWAPPLHGSGGPPTCSAVVLDVFGGTGTTAGVARALGRIGVSVDLSHDYSRLADYMIHRSGRFAKVVNRTNRENQQDLFGVPV